MCGIAGFVDTSGCREADAKLLDAMLDTLVHRGPDSFGKFCFRSTALGFRRLAILDLDSSEQPLFNESKTLALVGNGEIYNYIELRQELMSLGHTFSTNGDMEVILHGFEEWGKRLTGKLNGQFSFALYELNEGRLHLVRDQFGITPLHYGTFGSDFVFGSEIKAMLKHPAVTAKLDLVGLDQVLCFPGTVSPRTMFQGIRSLQPGHWLVHENGNIKIEKYWDLDYPVEPFEYLREPSSVVESFIELFDASVEKRLRSDVPVGLYLSGGLDSSYLGASVRNVMPNHDLTTFSVIFPNNRAINERKYQLLMAKQLKSHHIEIPFEAPDIIHGLKDMLWHCETPVTETYNICSMAMSQAAQECGVKAVLGGEGADELLAGYPGYRFDVFAARNQDTEISVEEAIARKALWGDSNIRYERSYGRYRSMRNGILSKKACAQLAQDDCISNPPVDPAQLHGRHRLHQRSYIDMKLRLADHLLGDHGDRMAMAHSIEARFPFLDTDLVKFLTTVDPEMKLAGMDEKFILREAAKRRLRPEILKREKFGFRSPGSGYLLNNGGEMFNEYLSRDRIEAQGIFDPDAIEKQVERHKCGGVGSNPHADDDLPLLALTTSILMDSFNMKGVDL